MIQPESLKSDSYQPWSRGRGTDVWAMLRAAVDGDLTTIKVLVARDPNLLDCEYAYYRPMHFAVRENRRDVVQFLLEAGADPMCGGNGFRPVYKPGGPGNHQWPLDLARERGYTDVLALLESKIAETHKIGAEGESLAAIVRSRNVGQLSDALDARPDLIDAADGFGNQPIHWAVMTRQMPLIDLVLERGADINVMRPDGARPLDLTNGDYWYRGWQDVPREAMRRHEVLIGYLLARGAEYDISTAAKIGDLERVRALLDQNPALANQVPPSTGYYNGVPLRCAAGAGHLDVVRLLLERGANPNQPEPVAPHGGALREAIGGKHWEIVKLLLQHRANPNAMVESSGNCMWAARDAGPEILDLMASYGGVLGAEMACYAGDTAYIGALLDANPALPVHEHLREAIGNDHRDLVAMVLRHQPDVLKRMGFAAGQTLDYTRWLLERGMDPNHANWLGITPLHRFALDGNLEMAALVLEFGALLDPEDDEYSSTPLGWAARSGHKDMVEWLLARGANPRLPRDKSWARPVEWARRRGHDEIAATLRQAAG
ncbi:MAG TPA: ankyrin repeat domain-containing protein [Gemmatimonadales bacterium]